MSGARGWLLAGVVAVLIALAAYFGQPRQDSPEHSSSSDAANGASAARLFAESMGHPADQIAGRYELPDPTGVMFIFTPTSPFTSAEAQQTRLWVQAGGTLVYASEQGDPELDGAFQVTRLAQLDSVSREVGNPVLQGVSRVAGAASVIPLDPAPDQVPVLRDQGGGVTGILQRLGSGTVVVLSDPLVLCNGYLDKLDNGRLLADLLGVADAAGPAVFDEYHHGLVLSDLSLQAWVTTPWGAALVWLLVAIFTGLVLRGRGFGPLIPRPVELARSDVEWSVAVGQMLRRSGARVATLGLLTTATERSVAARTGLPLQPRERFWNALWMHSPQLAAELAEAEHKLSSESASDGDLIRAAQRLHRIAYPASEQRRGLSATRESR